MLRRFCCKTKREIIENLEGNLIMTVIGVVGELSTWSWQAVYTTCVAEESPGCTYRLHKQNRKSRFFAGELNLRFVYHFEIVKKTVLSEAEVSK